jgi:NAD(P)-dependent dehydrogenase (short-subunit alcohol dehydrogenase family)
VSFASIIDKVVEAPVVTSFTNVGYAVRSRLDGWTDLDSYDLSGRRIAITGPTSGLGLAATRQLAKLGATLVLVARNELKAQDLRADLVAAHGNDAVSVVRCDMANFQDVRAAAKQIAGEQERLDVLIHNAGSLFNERRTTPDGMELTTAVQVVGPFLMTGLLLDNLADGSRVLTMSSGGMYSAGLTISRLQMDEASYKGAEQYARVKRAQVTLNEMWAERTAGSGIRFHALHPGWADTPGVEESLPTFRKIVGPFLRSPAQGADTLVWLAADDGPPLQSNGRFWLDRRIRPVHKLPSTRRTDTRARRRELWDWVAEAAGWDLI